MHIIKQNQLIFLDIIYYRPNSLLLQEFLWNYDDLVPELPRTHNFLLHWKNNIEATIQEVLICQGGTSNFRPIDLEKFFQPL